jgi:hypothetical protein
MDDADDFPDDDKDELDNFLDESIIFLGFVLLRINH